MTYCAEFDSDLYLDNGYPDILKSAASKPEFHVLCELPSPSFKGENQVIEVRLWFDEYPGTEEFKDAISSVIPYKRILKTKCIHWGSTYEYVWGSLEGVDEERGLLEDENI